MSILHIHLLGGFQLIYGDALITTVNSPRLQSLLAYLLLHAGVPQSRQQLAFLLWPDSNDARGRNSLRNLLHQLRHALPAFEDFIQTDDETIVWRSGASYTLDVAAFDRAITSARSADQPSARSALENAITLYQGDLFPGAYEDWLAPLRAQLRSSYATALEQLIAFYTADKEITLALQAAERLRQFDPLHETAYLQLIQLSVARGDFARAVSIYQGAVELLQRELGVAPGPELRRAIALVKAQHQAISPAADQVTPPYDQDALVGRAREMAYLQQIWRTLKPGQPQVVLLSGEPGIGKSHLAEALLDWVAQQQYPTIRAHCYAGEGALAYAPVVEWLRTPVVTKAIGKLDRLWQRELLRLLPELRTTDSKVAPPSPITEAWQRRQFFEAVAHALLALPQPLLLFLDDWQWSDWETLEWLNFLLRFATHHSLLVVGTIRRAELDQDHRLHNLLLTWQRVDRLREIALAPLDEAETIALANQVAGYALPPAQAKRLAGETEGNPLFVVESIRAQPRHFNQAQAVTDALRSSTTAAGVPAALPAKVKAVIEYRLAQLSPLALAFAGTAAVIGRRFTYELLITATSQPEDEVIQGLDELCQRRIVQEVVGGIYDFSHDKVREVAYQQLSLTRRQLLHRKVGQSFTQQATADQAAISIQCAFHFEQANLLDQAVRYYIQAAAAAADLHAYDRAAQLYARAIEIAGKLNLPTATLIKIYSERGRLLEHAGEYGEAMQLYLSLERLARQRGDKTMEATAVTQLASVYSEPTTTHDLLQAQTMLARGLQLARELGDGDLEARLFWSQMVVASHYGEDDAAQTAGAASLALCRRLQLQARLPFVLNDLSINLRLSGRQTEGQRHAEEARTLFHAQANLPMLADNLAQQAWSDYHQLRFADSMHWAQESATLCHKIENGWNLSLVMATRGLVNTLLGEWGNALADLEESIKRGKAAGFAIAATLFPTRLGALLRTLGASEHARLLHEEAHTAAHQQAPFMLAAIEAQLAQDNFALGEPEQGLHWLQAALRHQPQGAISRAWITLADLPLATVAAAEVTGDWAQATHLVEQTVAEVQQRQLPVYLPVLQIAQARCYQAGGQIELATRYLHAVLALAKPAPLVPVLWQAQRMLAALYQQQQRRPEAEAHQQQAAAHVRTLAAALPDSRLRHAFLATPAVLATLSALD